MSKWPEVALGDIFEIARGGSPRPIQKFITSDPDGVNWIMIGDASEGSKYIHRTKKRIRKNGVHKSRMVYPGDFLLTNSMSFGRPYILKTSGCIHDGWLFLRSLNDNVDQDFFYHLLGSGVVYSEFKRRAAGAVVKNLNIDLVKSVKIPLPPKAEQKRIATILDKADAIRQKRQQAIKLADEFLRAAFLDMFGDPVTNPKKWRTVKVEGVCSLVRGSSPRPKGDPRYYGGNVPRLMVADLTRDGWLVTPQIDSLTEAGAKLSRPIKAGTIVMAVSGNVGVVSQLAIDACIHDGFVAFKELSTDIVKEIYFMLCLHFMKMTHEKRKAGAIFQNLTTHDIKNMEFMLPPISIQNRFCNTFDLNHSILSKIERLSLKANDLFNSLTQRAFRGDL
jgi:restriction endonuclease S subunit